MYSAPLAEVIKLAVAVSTSPDLPEPPPMGGMPDENCIS